MYIFGDILSKIHFGNSIITFVDHESVRIEDLGIVEYFFPNTYKREPLFVSVKEILSESVFSIALVSSFHWNHGHPFFKLTNCILSFLLKIYLVINHMNHNRFLLNPFIDLSLRSTFRIIIFITS